jgi:hypothetical protein
MIQQLIEWMEEQLKEARRYDTVDRLAYASCLDAAKTIQAKSLQATEQCKWAVVSKLCIYDNVEDAMKDNPYLNTSNYIIVKIVNHET